MLDKTNKFFAFLAKQYFFAYLLIGILFGLLFSYFVDAITQKIVLEKLYYPALFIIAAQGITMYGFYGRHELGSKGLPMRRYITTDKDSFFYSKINSNISLEKKLLGYLYVLLRVIFSSMVGVFCGAVFFSLASHA